MAPEDVPERRSGIASVADAEREAITRDDDGPAAAAAAAVITNTPSIITTTTITTTTANASTTSTSTPNTPTIDIHPTSTATPSSPQPSRDPSPSRSSMRQTIPSGTRPTRSRRSSRDPSLDRTSSTHSKQATPSAAAVQRALANRSAHPSAYVRTESPSDSLRSLKSPPQTTRSHMDCVSTLPKPVRTGRICSTQGESSDSSRQTRTVRPSGTQTQTQSDTSTEIHKQTRNARCSGAHSESSSDFQKRRRTGRQADVPHWPVSPRLKSPPPSAHQPRRPMPSIASVVSQPVPQKQDVDVAAAATPSIVVETSSPPLLSDAAAKPETEQNDNRVRPSRGVGRGVSGVGPALETVHEGSLPSTPSTVVGPELHENSRDETDNIRSGSSVIETDTSATPTRNTSAESGSESGGNGSSGNAREEQPSRNLSFTSQSRLSGLGPKRSYTTLSTARGKMGGEGSIRNMIVETETVSSIPQVALQGGTGDRGLSGRPEAAGSLRLKPSNETIRPSREKKKKARKAPSISGATTKADIFEYQVANAVDATNSSDSEETFVYESNPPDSRVVRTRYHSRTPSATSMASQVEQFNSRSRQPLIDGTHSVAGKKSMKFTSTHSIDDEAGNSSQGRKTQGLTSHRHHHIGRFGRRGGHASLFDSDSPFPDAKGSHPTVTSSVRNSRPSSPRNTYHFRITSGRKANGMSGYDLEGEGADDERTPLVGSIKSGRGRHPRRPNSSSATARLMGYEHSRGSCCQRWSACLLVTLLIIILSFGTAAFIFALSKPLLDVYVAKIENVLASEQEIMLDLDVRATNPNIFAITVTDLDVNIFAKSKYVGSERFWRNWPSDKVDGGSQTDGEKHVIDDGDDAVHISSIDEGTDPIEDPSGDVQTMLLGRIFEFDSPLTFDPSPLQQRSFSSVGEMRLAHPGNKTEAGGTQRWERVLQHQFELIVRGVLKYQIPLSSRDRTAPISASIVVYPQNDDSNSTDVSSLMRRVKRMAAASTESKDDNLTYKPIQFFA